MPGLRLSNGIGRSARVLALAALLTPGCLLAGSPNLDANGYTIQLIALPSAERLRAFVRDRGVSDLVATSIIKNGKTHYVLLLGSYADKASALAAAKNLPQGLEDLTPWVRPTAGLLAAAPK